MNVIRVKPGVEFTVIAPGGFRILAALVMVAERLMEDLTITSAADGEHSGEDDPHKRGLAYDIRSRDLVDAAGTVEAIQSELGMDKFYVFLESPATDNEHIHVQLRHNISYP